MLRLRDDSITTKLTWMNMLVSGAALLLASGAFITYETVLHRRTMVRDLSMQAQIIGANCVSAVLFNDSHSAENTLEALRAAPHVTSAWIYTADGQPFAGYQREGNSPPPQLPPLSADGTESYHFIHGQLEIVHPVTFQRKLTAIVYIQSDLQGLYNRLESFVGIGVGVMLASLLAAFLVSSISRRAIAKPIQDLSETARRVSRDKDYAVRATPIEGSDEIAALVDTFNGMLTQIQERDDALHKAQEQLNLALMSAAIGTWNLDIARQVMTWGDSLPLLFGLKPGTFSGKPDDLLRLVHSEDREAVAKWMTEYRADDTLLETEFRAVWREGAIHFLGGRGKLHRDMAGQPARLTGVCWDITERKRAEEALRESEVSFRLLFAGNPVSMWVYDLETLKFMEVNDAAVSHYGYSREEFLSMRLADIRPADDAQLLYHKLARERKVLDESGPWRHRLKDGRIIRVQTTSHLLTWNGRQSSLVVVQDITARLQVEEEIRQLNAELEQRVAERTRQLEASNRELEAFTYSVSHDLRAPLRHVDGFSKLLVEEHGAELSADALDYVATIRDSVVQMGTLIDDLLNLGRVGRKSLVMEVAGLNSLVDEVRRDLMRANPDREIEWKVDTLPFVECDPGLMKQVFVNLLANAVKFTRPRKPAIIAVGVADQDGARAIFVRDNGVGFSMKYANKLFGVFQRLHRSEDFEGTGVGLATVQRIINKHGGRVWAQAELDRGAAFYFTIGSAEDPAAEKRA
jgi:PAS domain S-box-containing protein